MLIDYNTQRYCSQCQIIIKQIVRRCPDCNQNVRYRPQKKHDRIYIE